MSLAELLPAIRALPRAEKMELLHQLIDSVARPDLPDDDVIRGALAMHFIHSEEGFAANLQQLLQDESLKK